uniref:TonB_dep_Rec domain-containing protein n=1 Tax=Macrostomum lignano TaxID=282301 RepID=A0A1I8FKP5_9PLAT
LRGLDTFRSVISFNASSNRLEAPYVEFAATFNEQADQPIPRTVHEYTNVNDDLTGNVTGARSAEWFKIFEPKLKFRSDFQAGAGPPVRCPRFPAQTCSAPLHWRSFRKEW